MGALTGLEVPLGLCDMEGLYACTYVLRFVDAYDGVWGLLL